MLKSLLNWEFFKNAGVIHIFISKPDEPDTRPIIEHCWSTRKKIVVPVVLPEHLISFILKLNHLMF
ncbi:MAG: hypothetical protein Ct9H300mP28_21690 [Pseudomonadota bacterium]|nr:MAG: hypothetical protein Ct9H300mP28_21690 [Pseudomonadota bacterium]